MELILIKMNLMLVDLNLALDSPRSPEKCVALKLTSFF